MGTGAGRGLLKFPSVLDHVQCVGTTRIVSCKLLTLLEERAEVHFSLFPKLVGELPRLERNEAVVDARLVLDGDRGVDGGLGPQ